MSNQTPKERSDSAPPGRQGEMDGQEERWCSQWPASQIEAEISCLLKLSDVDREAAAIAARNHLQAEVQS